MNKKEFILSFKHLNGITHSKIEKVKEKYSKLSDFECKSKTIEELVGYNSEYGMKYLCDSVEDDCAKCMWQMINGKPCSVDPMSNLERATWDNLLYRIQLQAIKMEKLLQVAEAYPHLLEVNSTPEKDKM